MKKSTLTFNHEADHFVDSVFINGEHILVKDAKTTDEEFSHVAGTLIKLQIGVLNTLQVATELNEIELEPVIIARFAITMGAMLFQTSKTHRSSVIGAVMCSVKENEKMSMVCEANCKKISQIMCERNYDENIGLLIGLLFIGGALEFNKAPEKYIFEDMQYRKSNK